MQDETEKVMVRAQLTSDQPNRNFDIFPANTYVDIHVQKEVNYQPYKEVNFPPEDFRTDIMRVDQPHYGWPISDIPSKTVCFQLRKPPTILLVGYGRAGKDEGLKYLSEITGLTNAGTTSLYLNKYVAKELGLSDEECYARRHESDEMRDEWYRIGNELRTTDPGKLIREALAVGPLSGGVRDYEEIVVAVEQETVDYVVWIANRNVKIDKTVKFGPEHCDAIIENHGTLQEYHKKLRRFANTLGLLK